MKRKMVLFAAVVMFMVLPLQLSKSVTATGADEAIIIDTSISNSEDFNGEISDEIFIESVEDADGHSDTESDASETLEVSEESKQEESAETEIVETEIVETEIVETEIPEKETNFVENNADLSDTEGESIVVSEETESSETSVTDDIILAIIEEGTESIDDSAAVATDDEIEMISDDILSSGTCGDNLTWTLTEDGVLTISGTGKMDDFDSTISNYCVGPWSYWWDNGYNRDHRNLVTSVVIQDGVTSIGNYAFCSCKNLESVLIPDSVVSIGYQSFINCTSLGSITIPDSVLSIGYSAFNGCSSMISATIGNGVSSIGSDSFRDCTGLTSIIIPGNVTTIGSSLFKNCSSLTEVIIDEGVISIGDYAFQLCTSLTSITVPDTVTSIGSYAFQGCTSLSDVSIGAGVLSISDYAFANCSGLTNISIPDNVVSIGSYAFQYCTALADVTIGNGVTTIGDYSFQYCTALSNLTLGNTITTIGDYAFRYCSVLNNLVLENSITTIGDYAFQYCNAFTCVMIGDTVTEIGDYAFQYCGNVTEVTIGENVSSIGKGAFQYCSSMTSVSLGKSISDIYASAFDSCTMIEEVWYGSTRGDWKEINFRSGNSCLTDADIHYTFEFGVDNNSFANTNYTSVDSRAGFVGSTSYGLITEYFAKLASYASKGEVGMLKAYATNIEWDGACHGIASTMGLLFEGIIDVSDICSMSGEIDSYYEMLFPCYDTVLLNSIHYYQLLQLLDAGKNSTLATSFTRDNGNAVINGLSNFFCGYDSLHDFLEKLVYSIKENGVLLWGYNTHSVLVTGWQYNSETKQYVLEVYDENSVCSNWAEGYPTYITIDDDYSSFSYGNILSDDNYSEMFFIELSSLEEFLYTSSSSVKSTNSNTKIMIPEGNPFTIVNGNGESLSFDGESFSGNIDVNTIDSILRDSLSSSGNVYYIVEIDGSNEFELTVEGRNIDISIYNDSLYQSLSGTGVNSATISLASNSMEISGTDYTFEAYISTEEQIAENENGLVSVSGTASADVSISTENTQVKVVSDAAISNIETANYVGTTVNEGDGIESATSFTLSGSEEGGVIESTIENATVQEPEKTDETSASSEESETNINTDAFTASESSEKQSESANTVIAITALTNTSKGIKLNWSMADGADGYNIYRKTSNGKYTKIKTITSGSKLSYTDTKVKKKNGTAYIYKVVPYTGDTKGTASAPKTTVRLVATKLSSVKNTASKKITVKWKKATKVTGYQIQYSTNKKFKKNNKFIKVSGAKKVSKTISKLKSGKTYYIRIRTYKKVKGTLYYSAWSSKKKVTVK